MAEPISQDEVLEPAVGTIWRTVLDGVLVLAPGSQEIEQLTKPGDRLWGVLQERVPFRELIRRLSIDYNTPGETIRKDIEPIIDALLGIGAIRRRT